MGDLGKSIKRNLRLRMHCSEVKIDRKPKCSVTTCIFFFFFSFTNGLKTENNIINLLTINNAKLIITVKTIFKYYYKKYLIQITRPYVYLFQNYSHEVEKRKNKETKKEQRQPVT